MKKLLVLNLLVVLILSLRIDGFGAKTWVEITPGTPRPATVLTRSTADGGFIVDVSFTGFYLNPVVINSSEYQQVSLPGAYPLLDAGNPDLPFLNATLNIPATGHFMSRISSAEYVEYENVLIAPSKGNLPITGEASTTPFNFSDSYNDDLFYPGALTTDQQAFILRNLRGQSFNFQPFQYNPVTRTLRVYYSLSVEVFKSGNQGDNELTTYDSNIKGFREMAASFQSCFANNQTRSGQLPDENGSMLVVCPADFMSAIKPFTDWKNACGITTSVVDAGLFSTPEELRNFIQQHYYAVGNLAYLLLVGDADQVPPFMIGEDASDNYYGYLAGDDHYPEVYVGRFSAENADELMTQVNRTLEYEKATDSDSKYLSAVTGVASTLEYGDDNESDFQHIRNLLNTLRDSGYDNLAELYDGSQGGLDADGYPTAQMASDRFNQGTGVILYSGHGGINSWLTSQISSSLVNGLNNHGRYPFIWSVACETGNFVDHTCLAETWLRATDDNGKPAGAVAALMASGVQTSMPPMEAQDEMVNQLAKGTLKTFGGVSHSGLISMNNVYGRFGYAMSDSWILFGDPSLTLRTKAPDSIHANHKPYIGKGNIMFTVSANVANGSACLSQDGITLGYAPVVQGNAQIVLNVPAAGTSMLLTITSANYFPYSAELEVMNTPADAVAVTPVNHSKLVPVNPVFEWNPGDGAKPDNYRFFIGTDYPPTNIVNGATIINASYSPEIRLHYNTTYYWRVESSNSHGNAAGIINDFTTVFRPDEDFEAGSIKSSLAWISEGGSWTTDNHGAFDGDYCGRSAEIPDNGFSSLKYTCNVISCDFVSFWRKTSTESNRDKLIFLVDGLIINEWSGETPWGRESYSIAPGLHELEWRYTKDVNINCGEDAVWLDDIHLPVHEAMLASTTPVSSVCSGMCFSPESSAANFNSITWQTSGDGTFNDANLLSPQYTPGPNDLSTGAFLLTMNVQGYEGCPDFAGLVMSMVNPVPQINLPADTMANADGSLFLDGTCENGVSYEWIQPGVNTPYITVNESLAVDNQIELTLKVSNEFGCSSEKTTTVHFVKPDEKPSFEIYPNPCTDYFTIQPQNGFMPLNRLYMVNAQGAILWQQDSEMVINGSLTFDLPQLASGLYMVVAETDGGTVAQPILIKP